ncbi:MAG: hypothetical protein AB7K71_30180 [Polyangiaceae bacterium]
MSWLGLTHGEAFVVVFVFVVVVTAPWFPKAGAWIADRLMGSDPDK